MDKGTFLVCYTNLFKVSDHIITEICCYLLKPYVCCNAIFNMKPMYPIYIEATSGIIIVTQFIMSQEYYIKALLPYYLRQLPGIHNTAADTLHAPLQSCSCRPVPHTQSYGRTMNGR